MFLDYFVSEVRATVREFDPADGQKTTKVVYFRFGKVLNPMACELISLDV
jgi:hypothetical protein